MLAAEEPALLAHLEKYLSDRVGPHFRGTGKIAPEDFWLILIWKANRAKNNERRRFEAIGGCSFAVAIERIATALWAAKSPEARLRVLMAEWGMRLPTASAVLTILYPDHFTVYDIRVCNELGAFHQLGSRQFSERLFEEYLRFVAAVEAAVPSCPTLRGKDHHLWGRSLMRQVKADLSVGAPARNPRMAKSPL